MTRKTLESICLYRSSNSRLFHLDICAPTYSNFNRTLPDDSKPVLVPHKLTIDRKAKSSTTKPWKEIPTAVPTLNGTGFKRKRSLDEIEDEQDRNMKRGKIQKIVSNDELVIVDDSSNGAIIIEDD